MNGGAAISKDLYVGGNLFIDGQNMSTISGITTIGSFSGTGVLSISNIQIGKTLSNTAYKLIGSVSTTSNINNVYAVSFKNLTTSSFDAVVYRIDGLGSGWTDANACIAWQITP